MAMPEQLRKPVAKIFSFLPSGSKERTLTRRSSVSQVAPSGRVAIQACRPPLINGWGNMSSATFDPERTESNIRLPSGVKTMSRVQ
jgi:hypothetical protein